MSLWGGWVFDTVVTRRWCVVRANLEGEAMAYLGNYHELLTSPGEVVEDGRTIGSLTESGVPTTEPPEWIPGSAGEIWTEDMKRECQRKREAEKADLEARRGCRGY